MVSVNVTLNVINSMIKITLISWQIDPGEIT